MAGADLCAQRDVLPVTVTAYAVDDELLGNLLRDARAEFGLYQVQHQVQWRNAAGAGEPIAVDGEELVAQQDPWEFFAQSRQVFPVNGRLVLIEQTGLRERISAGAQRA